MAKTQQRRFARVRRVFRWCRICLWLVILAVVLGGIYLNEIGLPDFLKRPMLTRLHDEGVQLDFSRIRLRWYRGIVADDASFTLLKIPEHPKFSSAQAELNLDFHALLTSRLQVKSVAVKNGNFVWPVAQTNFSALSFSNITARIQLSPNDELHFAQFAGEFANTRIQIAGTVTNISAIRAWKFPASKKTGKGKAGENRFVRALEKIHLSGSPELTIQIDGDAADPKTLRGSLRFIAGRAETPWLKARNLEISADLPDWANGAQNNFARVKMDFAETRWGSASNFNSVVKLLSSPTNAAFETDLKFSAKEIHAKENGADSLQFAGRVSLSNLVATEIRGKANLLRAKTKFGQAESAQIVFFTTTNSATKLANVSWGIWKNFEPFRFNWESHLAGVETPKLKIDNLSSAGSWSAPQLMISNLDAQLFGGGLRATGTLDVASRQISLGVVSDLDVKKFSPLLSPFAGRWLAKYDLEKPPHLDANLRATVSPWTNSAPDWRGEVLPTLSLNGKIATERGSYRDLEFLSAKTDFAYSNRIWTLPNLRVERTEGSADLNLVANDFTQEFHWLIHSDLDPKIVRPFLNKTARRVLDDFQLTTPPSIRAELRGRWNAIENISGTADVALENFSYRSNHIDSTSASLQLTNQQLRLTNLRLKAGEKSATADGIALDFPSKRLSLTNIHSTVDPYLVATLINKHAIEAIAPYRFTEPPAIIVNGGISIDEIDDVDLHFQIDGNQFRWMKLDADKMSGEVDWVGSTLLVTNVHASVYSGSGVGWGYFEFPPHDGANYRFDIAVADVDLRNVVKSLRGKTNRVEGLLHGQLTIESGNTRDGKTAVGHGRANVRDGLLWDVPLFGIFSPMLNAILPGAGSSRAREASATFTVSNGIVYSDDLEFRAATLRMQYRGGVDFQQRIDARVEAELLRDTWIVGRLVSFALTPLSKLFEFKITGTLSHPESEPVYIPNFLMMTLRPFHTIKKALAPDKPIPATTEKEPAQN